MIYVFASTIAFVLLCFFVIRPGIAWAFAHTVKGGQVGETHVWFTLAGVLLSAFITDVCGVQSITGAFLFGLSIPHDHIIRSMIEEKLHDFLSGILMPLFYIICGLRADLGYMLQYTSYGMLAFVISSSFMVKIISTVVCSLFLRMPLRDGFAIGALMNTKGTMALVVLNTGRDNRVRVRYENVTFDFRWSLYQFRVYFIFLAVIGRNIVHSHDCSVLSHVHSGATTFSLCLQTKEESCCL